MVENQVGTDTTCEMGEVSIDMVPTRIYAPGLVFSIIIDSISCSA